MDKNAIKASIDSFINANGITKANWSQEAAVCCLMQVTIAILKSKDIALPQEVRAELFDAWKFKGLACNASQLRQFLFETKEGKAESTPMPYKFND